MWVLPLLVLTSSAAPTPPCYFAADGTVRGPNAEFRIEAQSLRGALNKVFLQSGLGYFVSGKPQTPLDQINAPALQGWYSFPAALSTLLAGSGLQYRFVEPCQVQIEDATRARPPTRTRPRVILHAAATPDAGLAEKDDADVVVRAQTLNTDIIRTSEGPQAYVVITREQIERSSASSIEGLIGQYVTANVPGDAGQSGGNLAGQTQFNLRGLGANQTLVLVDGRRVGGLSIAGAPSQGDLTWLPLAAIERIEVLPTTASAIYGGGATGGVINIVLRHDCESRLVAGYGSSFAGDAQNRRVYANHCFKFGDGRTKIRVAGSVAHEPELSTGQRDFAARARAEILARNSAYFTNAAIPPIGAQTNFRTTDGSGLNGPGSPSIGSVPANYTRTDGIAPLLANAGQYNLDLADSAQSDGGAHYLLRSGPTTHYLNATFAHEFSKALSAYVDATSSLNFIRRPESVGQYASLEGVLVPASAPNNPFHKDIIATVPVVGGDQPLEQRLESTRITAGVRYDLPESGYVTLEYTSWMWKFRRKQYVATSAEDDVASGKLNVFQDFNRAPLNLDEYLLERYIPALDARSQIVALRLGCSDFDTPAGSGMVLGSLEYRDERFDGGRELLAAEGEAPTTVAQYTMQGRRIASAYAETRIPVMSRATGEPARDNGQSVASVEADPSHETQRSHCGDSCCQSGVGDEPVISMQFAGRLDWYRVDAAQPLTDPTSTGATERVASSFASANPQIGLEAWPWGRFGFRSSLGTGFLPPSGDQFAPGASTVFAPGAFKDARRGNEPTGAIVFRAGGNRNIRPERSQSFSAGVVLKSAGNEGLHASADYVRIRKLDDIVNPAELFFDNPALFESLYPGRVKRAGPLEDGPITEIDATDINIARSLFEAWDFDLAYGIRDTALGDVTLWSRGTRVMDLTIQAAPASPEQNLTGLAGNAPKFSAVAGLTLRRGNWGFEWSARHFGPYQVGLSGVTITNQGRGTVSHQTYHDASVSYAFDALAPTRSIVVLFSAQNVFNRRPPFDAGSQTFVSPLGDARMGTYAITVSATF